MVELGCRESCGQAIRFNRLKRFSVPRHHIRHATALTDLAGAAVLHHHGARRAGAKTIEHDDKELQAASREVRGHGLTLQLLGQYLRLVEGGDILKRDTVRLPSRTPTAVARGLIGSSVARPTHMSYTR